MPAFGYRAIDSFLEKSTFTETLTTRKYCWMRIVVTFGISILFFEHILGSRLPCFTEIQASLVSRWQMESWGGGVVV